MLLLASILLQAFLPLLASIYGVGVPYTAFIPAVACCWSHCYFLNHCCCLHRCCCWHSWCCWGPLSSWCSHCCRPPCYCCYPSCSCRSCHCFPSCRSFLSCCCWRFKCCCCPCYCLCPGVPILAGIFTYCTVQWDILYWTIGLSLSFVIIFCYRTIGISNIGLIKFEKKSGYRISD
jgi:hypothetical protein